MICCFMSFNSSENLHDLVKHFDTEIEKAILFGCTCFLSGINCSKEKLFKERVLKASKEYAQGEVVFFGVDTQNHEFLKNLFIDIADFEIYS